MLLLAMSVVYYLLTGNGILILYPVAACAAAYAGGRLISEAKDVRKRKGALTAVTIVLLGILVVLKYVNFAFNTVNGIASLLGAGEALMEGLQWAAPLGVSFYTFSVLGYVIDVYNEIARPQKNFFKLLLYGMYFPTVLSGPILKYREDAEQFYEPHVFEYRQVTFGIQRMLWGFFKILVISERMKLVVNTVYGAYEQYAGVYIWLAAVCYAFQLYTNFSGCMDIVLGMSESFGIRLPENFRTPFFSRSISEYWRRWHITLGVWMKEYVFYPLLRTNSFNRLGKHMKERFGKKQGKQLTTFCGMLVLWFAVGVWHGGDWKFVIGSGLLHWFYIVSGELLTPFFNRWMESWHINSESRWMERFRMVRTFFLVCIGLVFFRADSTAQAVSILWKAVSVWNAGALLDGSVFSLGLDVIEAVIALVSMLLLLMVSMLQQKTSVREWIAAKRLPVRWLIWYALLFYTILLGYYGPGYSAAEFIYQGF